MTTDDEFDEFDDTGDRAGDGAGAPADEPSTPDPDPDPDDASGTDVDDVDAATAATAGLAGPAVVWWRRAWVRIGAAYSVLVLVIGWEYGLLSRTRSFPVSAVWAAQGWTRCLGDGMHVCTYVGYPVGVRLSLGGTYQVGVYLLNLVHVGPALAMNLLALLAIALGCAALGWIGRCLGLHPAAGLIAAGLYFLSPVVIQYRGLPNLYFGFAMVALPAACVADVMVSLRAGRRRRAIAGLAVAVVAGMAVVFCDPYAWIIGGVLAGMFVLVATVTHARRRHWWDAAIAAAGFAALTVPGAVFTLVAGKDAATTSTLDFYRAMSADAGLTLLPPKTSWWSTVLHLPHLTVRVSDYYGDGTNLAVYLGLVTVIAGIAGAVLLCRSRRGVERLEIAAFAFAGLACLALAFGPSLKWLDQRQSDDITPGALTFSDYLMPTDEATMSMPWAFVYGHQPVSSLRAAYRWETGARVVVSLFGGFVVVELWRRRRRGPIPYQRIAAGVLLAVLVVESGSTGLSKLRDAAGRDYRQYLQLRSDMAAQYADSLHQGEKVLFLPSTNDYLISGTAPVFRLHTWNIQFDKEVARISPLQPKAINSARASYNKGTFTADQACSLFSGRLLDALVLTEYDQRWDSYSWPPSTKARAKMRKVITATGIVTDSRFTVDDRGLSVIVRAAAGGPCVPSA